MSLHYLARSNRSGVDPRSTSCSGWKPWEKGQWHQGSWHWKEGGRHWTEGDWHRGDEQSWSKQGPASCRDWGEGGIAGNDAVRSEEKHSWSTSDREKKWSCDYQPADTDVHEPIRPEYSAQKETDEEDEKEEYDETKAEEHDAEEGGRRRRVRRGMKKSRAQAAPEAASRGAPMAAFRWLATEFAETGKQAIEAAAARARADGHMCNVRAIGDVEDEFPLQCGYTKEFFQTFTVERHWAEHNAALKWFREAAEIAPLNESRPILFSNDYPMMIPVIKESTEPDWSFDLAGGRLVPWTWQSMVAHLDDPSIECVVDGPFGRAALQTSAVATSSGDQQPGPHQRRILGCELAAKDDPDYNRHTNAKQAGVKWNGNANMAKCDFMLTRNDGTVCFLHPNWSNNNVEFFEGFQEGIPDGSDGKHGYFKIAAMRRTCTLKFDTSKTPTGVKPACVPLHPA